MDKPKTTAKDFFLWAGATVSFYWTVIAFILLTFDYINFVFPNPLTYYPVDPYQSGISYEMASIVVLLPLFMFLMWLIHNDASKDSSRNDIWVRRWALIFTLFVAGVTMVIDLITLLTTFLNGEELTTAFLLKTGIVFFVAVGVFMHFIAELKGYWNLYPSRRNAVRISVAILAVVTIGSGFHIVGTPAEARLARFDAQRVGDLQNIQSQVITYYQAKQKLPDMISDLNNSLSYGPIPVDPQTGTAYLYERGEGLSFKLCASFNAKSHGNTPMSAYVEKRADNWQHEAGTACFDRTLDPSFYPPLVNKI